MIAFPNAKINLGLHVVNKRDDGFHNIESIFIPAPWFDILEIIPNQPDLLFSSSGIPIPGHSKSNLCLAAFHLLQHEYNIAPVHIHLHKNIPIGAGLGGGSSDAAFTLRMLNASYDLSCNEHTLETYAQQLGSDCPFFIRNQASYVTGTGNELDPIDLDTRNYYIAMINPGIHISTKEAYSGIQPHRPQQNLLEALNDPSEWKNTISNDFERHLFLRYPQLAELKQYMYNQGAIYAAMTGSGSTVFGVFNAQPHFPDRVTNNSDQLVVSPFDIDEKSGNF